VARPGVRLLPGALLVAAFTACVPRHLALLAPSAPGVRECATAPADTAPRPATQRLGPAAPAAPAHKRVYGAPIQPPILTKHARARRHRTPPAGQASPKAPASSR
jgi:hypothetical protein